MGSYATRAQFYTHGLPAAACVPESRSLSSVIVVDSAFELPGHGFAGGEFVRFKALGEGSALCAGLSASALYKIVVISSDLFTVTLAGLPVTITDEGIGVISVVEDIAVRIDAILEACSSYVDANAKAYKPPFTPPFSPWVTRTVCKLAALDVALVLRRSNPSYSLDDVKAEADKAEAFLARLAKGEPMADNPADQTPGKAEAGARGWKKAPKDAGEVGL